MTIDVASALRAYAAVARPEAKPPSEDAGFGNMLAQTLQDAVQTTRASEQAMAAGASGKAEMVDVVTAVANAETTLETVIALRDRMISAYQDIMRMPI